MDSGGSWSNVNWAQLSAARQPTPVFLPGESRGQRSLEGYNEWGHKESDMTERLTLPLSFPLKLNPDQLIYTPTNQLIYTDFQEEYR